MAKLTDIQLVLLSAAAQRDSGALLPLPKRLKIEPGALTRVLKGLLKKGLVAEQPAPPDAPAWRDADDQRFMLVIAPAGLEAINVDPDHEGPAYAKDKPSAKRTRRRKDVSTKCADGNRPTRAGTKQALLIDLLRRSDGATIDQIAEATGWQRHTVRGAIAGALKKKLGLTVKSEKVEGRGRVYRIANID